MRLFNRRSKSNSNGSRSAAKERLKLVISADRGMIPPDKLEAMKAEIIAVISKYATVDTAKIAITIQQRQRDSWLVADVPLQRGRDQALNTGVEDA